MRNPSDTAPPQLRGATLASATLLGLLAACSGRPIDLGLAVRDAGIPATTPTSEERSSAIASDSLESENGLAWVNDSAKDSAFVSASGPGTAETELDQPSELDMNPVPEGHPASPDEVPAWCALGETKQERCGSGMDEDCDGAVDENALLGEPCATGCELPGTWLCNHETQQLVCFAITCYPQRAVCGNGKHDAGEQCDPSAGDPERTQVAPLQTYCQPDCRWATRFEGPCWEQTENGPSDIVYFKGGLLWKPCEAVGLVCSQQVRSCVVKLGERDGYRCPRLRRSESNEAFLERMEYGDPAPIYPMIESDDGECHISCSTDAQCPPAFGTCYMGTCVIW